MQEKIKISKKEVQYIADLARIELTEEEKNRFSEELSGILGYVEQLHQVNTENIEAMSQVTGMANVFKNDVVEDFGGEDKKILKENFPKEENGYIKVKQIL